MSKRTIVYKNVKNGSYFVQPYTMGPVAASEFGEATVIQSHEFEARVADVVIESLKQTRKDLQEHEQDETWEFEVPDKQVDEIALTRDYEQVSGLLRCTFCPGCNSIN